VKITKGRLDEAVRNGILSESQAESLWEFFLENSGDTSSFKVTHILYYLGGLIAIGAMSLFMNLGWEVFGGWGIFTIAAAYGLFGLLLAEFFSRKKGFSVPAGIMSVFATALVPLAVYGLQSGLGLWEGSRVYREYHVYIDWRWVSMELATLAAGAAALKRYKIPFLVFPVAATLWYMSMDLAPFLFRDADITWRLRRIVSLWFGLAMILFALRVDFRTRSKGIMPSGSIFSGCPLSGEGFPSWIPEAKSGGFSTSASTFSSSPPGRCFPGGLSSSTGASESPDTSATLPGGFSRTVPFFPSFFLLSALP